jgi:hypothetical protein
MSATALVRRGARRLTVRLRRCPEALLVGGIRCGSTSLFAALTRHAQVIAPSRKEIHFFDLHFDRGVNWYRSFFPVRGHAVSLDATPSYLVHPEAAARAHSIVPEARVIAVLREPADRAWSHYRYRRAKGSETLPFREVVERALTDASKSPAGFDRVRDISIIEAGLYAPQLRRWLDSFVEDRVFVIDSRDVFRSDSALIEVQRFMGLPPIEMQLPRVNTAPEERPDEATMDLLRSFYATPNAELSDMVGIDF